MALEQLLMTMSRMDSCPRELVLNVDIAMHQNEAQATETIKEVEACCAAIIKEAETHQACDLEKSHRQNMLDLESEAIAEEVGDHHTFLKGCRQSAGLSTQSLWGTNVSPAAPYW